MALLTCTFPLLVLVLQDLPGHNAHMRARLLGDILFPLPQHMQEIVRSIKVQDLVEGTRFDSVLLQSATLRLMELD